MKYRGFHGRDDSLRKEIVALALKAGRTELMLTPAASTIVRRADDCSTLPSMRRVSVFARDRVKK